MKGNAKYMILSIALAIGLCATQIFGNAFLILGILVAFLVLVGWSCSQNATLLVMLFFLPWSPLLRTSPDDFSFYTFGMIFICAISILKKEFRFKRYHIVAGILLLALTLISKLIDGSGLSFDYIAFMVLIILFPVVKEEWTASRYDYFQLVSFFSVGIILAALCAQQYANYPNIARYIRVDAYLTITRLSGFYGDPNFYTAQITAALGGCVIVILKEQNKRRITVLAVMTFLLMYCGFLSGSKSFALITGVVLVLWIIELLRMRGRTGLKIVMLLVAMIGAIYIASSALFGGLIDVLITRFSSAKSFDDFTTGRTELWENYLNVILTDWKVLVIGKGFTNIKVGGRSSHNTVIQMLYQFGLLGVPVLIAWTACFFRDVPRRLGMARKQVLNMLILLIGTFSPWLAIDALFFDEFFLLQMYAFMGCAQLLTQQDTIPNTTVVQADIPSSDERTNRYTALDKAWRKQDE